MLHSKVTVQMLRLVVEIATQECEVNYALGFL